MFKQEQRGRQECVSRIRSQSLSVLSVSPIVGFDSLTATLEKRMGKMRAWCAIDDYPSFSSFHREGEGETLMRLKFEVTTYASKRIVAKLGRRCGEVDRGVRQMKGRNVKNRETKQHERNLFSRDARERADSTRGLARFQDRAIDTARIIRQVDTLEWAMRLREADERGARKRGAREILEGDAWRCWGSETRDHLRARRTASKQHSIKRRKKQLQTRQEAKKKRKTRKKRKVKP